MEIRLRSCRRKRQTVHPESATLPKILNARVFVRIGEFHSAPKRASGGSGDMRTSACLPATLAAEALFEV